MISSVTTLPLPVRAIAVASALGAPFPGSEQGPAALARAGLLRLLAPAAWAAQLQPDGTPQALANLLRQLADLTAAGVAAGERLLVVGGDHAMAAGTWRGVGRALGCAPGLIWIDAHLDAHTPATSPSGNRHGMPLAGLFGLGQADMVEISGPPLDPARTVLLAVRSYEPAEFEQLQALGVRIFPMAEIRQRGMVEVFAEACRIVGAGPWGISLDVDALDPGAAPGVSTPVAGGLAVAELRAVLSGVLRHPTCLGLEIAEYNPLADADGRTARLIVDLVDAALNCPSPAMVPPNR